MSADRPAPHPVVARSIPEDYGQPVQSDAWLRHGARRPLTPEEAASPDEQLMARLRCCGAPQMCGALCMDDEESMAGARVVRRLDDAERTVAAVRELLRRIEAAYELPETGGVDAGYVIARIRSVLDAGRLT